MLRSFEFFRVPCPESNHSLHKKECLVAITLFSAGIVSDTCGCDAEHDPARGVAQLTLSAQPYARLAHLF